MYKLLYAGLVSRLMRKQRVSNNHDSDAITSTTNSANGTTRTSTLDAQRVISAAIVTRMHITENSYDLRRY